MRRFPEEITYIVAVLCATASLPTAASATDEPAPTVCSATGSGPTCSGSVDDLKAARKAFAHGIKLEKAKKLDQAFYEFQAANRLVPNNIEYLTAEEWTRQHLAGMHLQEGNTDLFAGKQIEALAEFRAALDLDPKNEFAQQRINDALGPLPERRTGPPQLIESADSIVAQPEEELHSIHYRGDARGLLTSIAASYGLTVVFDDNIPVRHVRFDLDNANFATAMQMASEVTKTFSAPIEPKVLFTAQDTAENHKSYDRMGLRSFYIPGDHPTDFLTELQNTMRTLFEIRLVSLNSAASTITLRGSLSSLEAASQFMGQIGGEPPEVMLDLQVYEVDHTYMRTIGLHAPDNFNLFNIPAAALAALGGQSLSSLLNQLVSSGGINQVGNSTIAALLAQLMSEQNSIFSQPLATFGGGLTFFGLSLDQLSATLSMNQSSVRQIDHVQLRASQGKEATFKLGSRYPVENASFSPAATNSAITAALGNQSYTAPFPSINYEDIGLTFKAKPQIHNNSDVALAVTVEMRALGAQGSNGIPIITNRSYTGGIMLKEGEPAVVAGMITDTDAKTLSGLPFFSNLAGLGLLAGQHTKQKERDELLILITPHVVSSPERNDAPEIWISR